ncbi:hypothetical protein GCM10017786_52380 [Amycolatopsis deserti]|uniref:Uncharacterized protein n=1 Tax=Amycolatopsis deserti TaxID=185696 RepID=A0ABQ3JD53_9PSEU|nr:hypothetical protein GCM10017786_52380 [Amycolatopsis deserti]
MAAPAGASAPSTSTATDAAVADVANRHHLLRGADMTGVPSIALAEDGLVCRETVQAVILDDDLRLCHRIP